MYAAEPHLSGLTGTTSHSDIQKIRIIGFFFENRLRWQLEAANAATWQENFYKQLFWATHLFAYK
jgi:hypothetical protein